MSDSDCWEFADELNGSKLSEYVVELAMGVRLSGSEDEARTFDFIEDFLRRLGFTVHREAAESLIGLPLRARLTVHTPRESTIPCSTYSLAPSTGLDGKTGELVYVGPGGVDDYRHVDARGKIVLSSGLAMPGKAVVVDQTGALAQIHINDEYLHEMCISPVWGSPTGTTIGLLPRTPAVGVTQRDGEYLRSLLEQGPVVATVTTETFVGWRAIPVLTADLPGNDEEAFVMFSGHVDSWYHGAMDNAAGNAVQLAVAEVLARRRDRLRRGLRLAFWSGHSHGRYAGSTWYADNHWQELHDHCVCHVNIDSVGAVGAEVVSVASSMAETYGFASRLISEGTGQELEYRRIGRAGDQSFWGIGVPSVFDTLSQQLATGSATANAAAALTGSGTRGGGFGWWWHTAEDTLDKIDAAKLLRDGRVYAAAIWALCTEPVLPFDYAAAAREIIDCLISYQTVAEDYLDLSSLIARARSLATDLDRFREAALQRHVEPRVVNMQLAEIGHALIPVNYTAVSRFDHDLAVSLPPVPGLRQVRELAGLDPQDGESKSLRVQLVRERNRVAFALNAAARAVGAAMSERG